MGGCGSFIVSGLWSIAAMMVAGFCFWKKH